MPLPLIGAAIAGIGSIAGGIGAAHAMNKYNNAIDQQAQDNRILFDKEYNADYTQRADAQNLLTNVRNFAKKSITRAEGQAAIAGATPEAEAIAKNQANELMATTASNIASQGAQYKAGVMDRYLAQKANLDNIRANGYLNQAGAWGQLGASALNIGGNMLMGGLKTGNTTPVAKDTLKLGDAGDAIKLNNDNPLA